MDVKELKKYIINNDLLITLLENIGCHSFVDYGNEIRCALPNDDDPSKISIFINDNLSVRIFTKSDTIHGSIFDLVMYINKCSFSESLKKVKSCLNIGFITFKHDSVNNHIDFYKRIKKNNPNDGNELKTYDLNILNRYSKIPHIDLVKKDGIFPNVLEKYSIRFDVRSDRIVFPHFKYNDKTKIVGLVGRTVNPAYESLKIPKYFPIDGFRYEKSKNLYGLSHNIDDIKRMGFVIVYEAEKSVLKSCMFKMPNSVSVGSHDISEFQKQLLIGLDVDIVIAFDNDIEKEYIHKITRELSIFRNISYIEDKWNLLRKKDSPVDRGIKRFNFLLKHKINV